MKRSKHQWGFRRIFSLQEEPEKVARGFALGSFIGMLPFPGFQMFISAGREVFLSLLLGRVITGLLAMVGGYYLSLFILNRKQQK
ncbi:MAG: DUF2062 domain-containing protein [Draconibacterium sp.]